MKTFNSNTLSVRHQFLWRKISRSSHPVAVVRKHLRACNFIKKRLQHRCFLAKSAKFLRTPFFPEHFQWLLNFHDEGPNSTPRFTGKSLKFLD